MRKNVREHLRILTLELINYEELLNLYSHNSPASVPLGESDSVID